MAIFDFPYHRFSTENPESSFRLKLGGSYQYSAPPVAPDQRIFKLKFKALKYFVNTMGVIDRLTEPEVNLARLEDFYALHKLHATFTYPHPVYGDIVCSFSKPINIPEVGDFGVVENIDIELVERPGMGVSAGPDMIQIEYGNLS